MIKLVYCIQRKEGLTRKAFQDYWLNQHASLVKELAATLGVAKYVQSHTFETPLTEGTTAARGMSNDDYDGLTEMWWQDEASMMPAGAEPADIEDAVGKLLIDEANFIDFERSKIFFAKEHHIIDETATS